MPDSAVHDVGGPITTERGEQTAEPKILVVSNLYPSPAQPVNGIFVHEQVKALRKSGIDARVVSGRPLWLSMRSPGTTIAKAREEFRRRRQPFAWQQFDGVPVAEFRFFASALHRRWLHPWLYRNALRHQLPRIACDFAYDLVHAHTAFLDGRAAADAARQRAVPMVLTEHTGPFSLIADNPLIRIHTAFGLAEADRIMAVSEALKRDIARHMRAIDADDILVVPNGVDTAMFDPAKEAHSKSGSGVSLLWVGHMVDVKRLDRLLDAFAIARRRAPALRLNLLGTGPVEAAIRQRARDLGVDTDVRFIPGLDREGVRREMAGVDCLVISSATETFGIVGIEAMAMGLPVLATDCGGPAEYLADPTLGELVANNTEDLAIGMQRIAGRIADFDAEAIRKHAVDNFDFSRVVARLKEVYSDVTGGAPEE